MFFYVSLFIACVISAIVVVYLYNALADVGKAVYRAFLPSSKNNSTRHVRNVRFGSKINDTPTPWGWKGGEHDTRGSSIKSTVPAGTTGLNALINDHGNESTSVGWPYREDKVESAGKAYKVTRKTAGKRLPVRGGNKQPWGW